MKFEYKPNDTMFTLYNDYKGKQLSWHITYWHVFAFLLGLGIGVYFASIFWQTACAGIIETALNTPISTV